MDHNKICFITCVNNEEMYQESVLYIKHLLIPKGFSIEFIAIRDANYLTEAYNQAMSASDAKYKVYLHQDLFIIHKNFIRDILKIFKSNAQIGMIGVAGAKKIPPVACWWKADKQYVCVYDNTKGKMNRANSIEFREEYVKVAAIDGLLMVTQYDVKWRDDIFTGWHFYDVSQSVEFTKQGYQVVVPRLAEPWCIHDCGPMEIDNGYEKYRNIFLDEYSTYLFPLVSILIPTYNRPQYFKIAFESAINQTYRNLEVIVCDNSTDEETAKIMESYLNNPRVRYLRNRDVKTKEGNFQKFKDITKGEYINWLMDDDVFHVDKITYMMQIYLEHEEVSLVTSYRQWIDGDGNPIESLTPFKCEKSEIFDGREIGKKMLFRMSNFVGEPTTVLIKRNLLEHHYWNADCRGYKTISDVVMWLELLSKGKMAYIVESLSSFRRHAQQEQAGINVVILSRIEWYEIAKEAYENGYFIENVQEYKQCLLQFINDANWLHQFLKNAEDEIDKKLHNRYLKMLLEAKTTAQKN